MCLWRMNAATNTATVLMIQLCRKCRSFLLPGCMTVNNATATCLTPRGKTRSDFDGSLAAFRPHFRPAMKIFNSTFFYAAIFGTALSVIADGVVAPGAKLEKLPGDFAFTEGATCDRAGNVFFVDQPNDRIMEWSAAGKLSTFLQPSGYANGMYFDAKGNLIACADEHNALWSIAPDKSVTVLVTNFEGKYLNGPNDVWIAPDGS